jgi:hypothetical protein
MRGTALCQLDKIEFSTKKQQHFFFNHMQPKGMKPEPNPNHDPNLTVVGPKHRTYGPYNNSGTDNF